jgi:hypothetical protein
MGLNVKRSDLFPVGTTVKCFGPISAGVGARGGSGGHGKKPSGSELASATVDAFGNLAFPTLGEGQWELYAEVGGEEVLLHGGSENFVPSAVVPNALTFNAGLLSKRGAVIAGSPASGSGTGGLAGPSGVVAAPLAERIQALRAMTGCAPNSLAPLI